MNVVNTLVMVGGQVLAADERGACDIRRVDEALGEEKVSESLRNTVLMSTV